MNHAILIGMAHFQPLFILLLLNFSSSASAAQKNCQVYLRHTLKGAFPFDADRIAKRLESGELKLKRVDEQAVCEVIGLPGEETYMVRMPSLNEIIPDGTIRSHGFDLKTRPRRDVAMRLIDQELGLNLVPETKLAKLRGEEVSLQVKVKGVEFRSNSEYSRYVEKNLKPHPEILQAHKEALEKLALLDLVGGNMDRNVSNFIYDETQHRLWAIDNADALPGVQKNPGMLWFWFERKTGTEKMMEKSIREKILSLDAEKLAKALKDQGLIEAEAIDQMKARIRSMQAYTRDRPFISIDDVAREIDQNFVQYSRFPR